MHYTPVFIFLLAPIPSVHNANILGIFQVPGKSHFIMFENLFKKLAELGHNVDIATHFPVKKPPPRYNQLSLVGSQPILVNNLSVNVFEGFSHYDMMHFITKIIGVNPCEAAFETDVLKNLRKTETKYDLIVTEIFGADCMLGFGYYFRAPVISLISSVTLPWANDRFGNPDNPAYIPTFFSSYAAEMSFFERLDNAATLLWSKFLYHHFTSIDANRVAKNFFGPDLPNLEELAYNTSLLLVNSHFSVNHPRPMVPNVIEVGGLHIGKPQPLSKYFESLVADDIAQGVILLTMGSMVMTETFDFVKLQGIFDAFAKLPYKVIWKANRSKFSKQLTIPANIHFEEWLPQFDILCHPNTKLFVTHGGLMGSLEAIYCGVPRIGIPLFADQEANIRSSEKLKMSVRVPYDSLNEATMTLAIRKILGDLSYTKNCKHFSQIFKDRPQSAIDTAVYWVEYVIRHKGAPHIRSMSTNLLWYQYYLIDIVVFLLGLLFVSFAIGFYLFKFLHSVTVIKKKIE